MEKTQFYFLNRKFEKCTQEDSSASSHSVGLCSAGIVIFTLQMWNLRLSDIKLFQAHASVKLNLREIYKILAIGFTCE